jgi:hypothetical protein
MNDDKVLVRPLFRILYGVVAAVFILATYMDLFMLNALWKNEGLKLWDILTWVIISLPFLFIWLAYVAVIIALRGKPPKYLRRLGVSRE